MKCRFFLFVFLFFNVINAQRAPSWVREPPRSDQYVIGIGFSDKDRPNYRALAKADALNDLATEISVNISSDLIDIMIEASGVSEEYARSEIRLSTRDELEGYESVDEYDDNDKNLYWVYYRLSKDYFKRYANSAIDLYDNYLMYIDEGNISIELTTLINCLEYIYRAAGQDITHESSGKNLRVEVPLLIKTLLSNIDIKTSKSSYEGLYGRGLDDAINVQAINRKNGKPIFGIDMEVRFERGSGEFLSNQFQTDRDGRFKIDITQIDSKEEQQVIRASLNLVKFKADIDKGGYLDNVLKGIARAHGLRIVIQVSEYRKDKVAVLVVGDGLSTMLLSSLISTFNNEYKDQTDFDIMSYREVEPILKREGFAIKPCTTKECQVEIGTKLRVDNLIFIKINYLANARLLNVSTEFSEVYSGRVPKSDNLNIPVKRGASADEVIMQNVSNIVSSFWSKFNPGTLNISSSIPSINVEITNKDDNQKPPENRTTPFEIELPPGTYILNFNKIGYVSRTEQMIINKSDRTTITVDLYNKTSFKAFTRSLLIPGAGQHYSSDSQHLSRAKMGKIIRWSLFAGVAASGYAWYSLDQSTENYEVAKETYLAETTVEGINSSRTVAQDKNQVMINNQKIFQGSLALIGIIWVGNAVDALVNFPDYGFTISFDSKAIDSGSPNRIVQPTISLTYKF